MQAHGIEHQRAELVGIELRFHLDAARIGTGDGERRIDQQDGDGEQQQELLMLGPSDEGRDQAALQGIAHGEEEEGDHGQAEQGRDLEVLEAHPGEVHADHHHLAVREVDDAHDAEDHRQAERHQPVDHAGEQAVDDGLGEIEEEVGGHQITSS